MLMGMVGSATPANSGVAPNGGMMFAELLESPEGLPLGQPELGLTTADSGSEEDMYLGDYSAAGQLNALMAASLGTAPNLSRKATTSGTSDSLETLDLSGAKSKSVAASNPDANALFVSGNGGLGYSFAVDSEPFSSRSAAEATGEAVDALNPNQPTIAPEQELTEIPGATAPRTPAAAEKLESNSQIALKSNTGIGAQSNNEGELNRFQEGSAPLSQVETKQLDTAQQAQSNQVTPAGGENSDKKEILSNRGPRNRSSKSNDSDSDNPVFSSIASGGFGSTGDSPIVTAVSGGMQSRQDGILGRGDAREEFASQISSRDSKGAAPESTNPEALPQLDLNAARSDFEQSLDRVAENFPLDSVAQQIVEVAEPDSGWISVEIQPPDLGKLEIMVSKQGDDYTARIIAHESSTEEALSLQQAELLEALNQHGLELKEVQIVSDSDSGSRWNLDSSNQQHSDSQERSEYYRERREDSQPAYPAADKPHPSSNATIQAAATQQVNFLV